jgi:hypothetical protein
MAYRTSYPDLGGTPMTMPHNRVTKYICGGVSTCGGSWTESTEVGDNVITTDTWESNKLFAMYYYRVSPTYSVETSTSTDNFKEVSANGGDGSYLSGTDAYMDYCNGEGTPGGAGRGNPSDFRGALSEGGYESCSTENVVIHTNPMDRWIHVEALWDTVGYRFEGSDNQSDTWSPRYRGGHKINAADGTAPSSISIGGFIRWPRASATGNYRYWAALYLDNTYSRVMLGNAANWDNCYIREPQIPSAWNTQSISVRGNLGAFTGNTAYLYVFDANNNHNATGYPVTIGGGGAGTTTTTTPDTTPPAPPTGLSVDE